MRSSFDRRVVPDEALALIRACQRRVPAHLGGGAALSGAHLAHRLSDDIDVDIAPAPDAIIALAAGSLAAIPEEDRRLVLSRLHVGEGR